MHRGVIVYKTYVQNDNKYFLIVRAPKYLGVAVVVWLISTLFQELPNGTKLDKQSANEFVSKTAELAESAHETVECTKTLLRTRGIKM